MNAFVDGKNAKLNKAYLRTNSSQLSSKTSVIEIHNTQLFIFASWSRFITSWTHILIQACKDSLVSLGATWTNWRSPFLVISLQRFSDNFRSCAKVLIWNRIGHIVDETIHANDLRGNCEFEHLRSNSFQYNIHIPSHHQWLRMKI